jgi:hypothetical protein
MAYGAKFESAYQDADEAYAGYAGGFTYNNKQYPFNSAMQWRLNSNNFAYEQSQQILLYQFANNVQNASFDDTTVIANAGNPPITQLTINAGEIIDAIEATNTGTANGQPQPWYLLQHGGNGGNTSTITLEPGDVIVEITGYTGNWFGWNVVAQLTITTRNGVTYGPYGNMSNVNNPQAFTWQAPGGQMIVAFSGSTQRVPEAGGSNSYIFAGLGASYAAQQVSYATQQS